MLATLWPPYPPRDGSLGSNRIAPYLLFYISIYTSLVKGYAIKGEGF
jgi:hypothetical protein